MKIFVTVGTTKFDSLIEYIDQNKEFDDLNIECQIANGKYIPKNHLYFKFCENSAIIRKYESADLIISHAGAGTIYKLLEMRKRIIIVPNLDRVDKHQLDLAQYMDKNKYALVSYKLDKLFSLIIISKNTVLNSFEKNNFFKINDIIGYISG
jgi:beta-1,4-N-acetylglucosaminyltransferase